MDATPQRESGRRGGAPRRGVAEEPAEGHAPQLEDDLVSPVYQPRQTSQSAGASPRVSLGDRTLRDPLTHPPVPRPRCPCACCVYPCAASAWTVACAGCVRACDVRARVRRACGACAVRARAVRAYAARARVGGVGVGVSVRVRD